MKPFIIPAAIMGLCVVAIVLEILFFKIPPQGHINVLSENLTNNQMVYQNLTNYQTQTMYFKNNSAMTGFVWQVNGPYSIPIWGMAIIILPIAVGCLSGIWMIITKEYSRKS